MTVNKEEIIDIDNYKLPEYPSKVDSNFTFTCEYWIVSVLNTDDQWFGLPGHSTIVIEGVGLEVIKQRLHPHHSSQVLSETIKYNATLSETFVRVCDIQSKLTSNPSPKFLANAKGHLSEIRIFKQDRLHYNYNHKCYSAEPNKVIRMLEAIIKDQHTVELYLQGEGPPISFQRWGKNSFFTDPKEGDNCAGWCSEKLAIADIGDGTGKPKPKLMVSACNIL